MSSEEKVSFMAGIFVGVVGLLLLIQLPGVYFGAAEVAMTECEKSLPRDMHCKITAEPVMEGNDNAG